MVKKFMIGRFKKGNKPWNKGIHWRKGICNSERAINYCYKCASLLQPYFTGKYNENNGYKVTGLRCENLGCKVGRYNFKKWWQWWVK